MALTCSPLDLLASSCNIRNASPDQRILIKLAILCRWANGNTAACDVQTLLAEACANGFNFLSKFQAKLVEIMLLCQISQGTPTPPQCDTTTSLVGWWKMEEATAANRLDSSGFGNTLSDNSGGVTQQPGYIGNSAGISTNQFLRSASVIVSPSLDLALNDTYTIACWVYLNSLRDGGLMLSDGAGSVAMWALYLQSNRFVMKANGAGSVVTANTFGQPSLNTWIFLLAEVNPPAGTVVLTVNNQFTDSLSQAAFQNTVAGQNGVPMIRVGSAFPVFTGFLDGRVDEARFYKNRLLSSADQTCLFNLT